MTTQERELLDRKVSELEFDKPVELSALFGEDWVQIQDPNRFGREVRKLVSLNEIENFHYHSINELTGDNHNFYIKTR
jgi:hypothetical protein